MHELGSDRPYPRIEVPPVLAWKARAKLGHFGANVVVLSWINHSVFRFLDRCASPARNDDAAAMDDSAGKRTSDNCYLAIQPILRLAAWQSSRRLATETRHASDQGATIDEETLMLKLVVNGQSVDVTAEPDTPLLWVLKDELGLTGTKFGCGAGLCGACTVHINGSAVRSCQMAVKDIGKDNVVTIEGLSKASDHPVQKAWILEQGAAMRVLPVGDARWPQAPCSRPSRTQPTRTSRRP